jgi:hypothetical protein
MRRHGLRSLVALASVALGVAMWLAMRLAAAHAIAAFAAQAGAVRSKRVCSGASARRPT